MTSSAQGSIAARLQEVLGRHTPLSVLAALSDAFVSIPATTKPPLTEVAIGLDSSVILKLTQSKYTDVVDGLTARQTGPVILPSQAVLEFWNNHKSHARNVAHGSRAALTKFMDAVKGLDPAFEAFRERALELIGELESEHGHLFDPSFVLDVQSLLQMLTGVARVSTVARPPFLDLAIVRKATRTPPGFMDDGYGDFFIWVEFLAGVLEVIDEGTTKVSKAVLVTDDKKIDWGGEKDRAHPILVAEAVHLTQREFEIWSLDRLQTEMKNA